MTLPRLLSTVAATLLTAACGSDFNPVGPGGMPVDDPVFQYLEGRQQSWCERITGETCAVYVSVAHPTYAAWVDWRLGEPAVFWNYRVLSAEHSWITDPRMAHEACHLKHGSRPSWTFEQKEHYADQCAILYAGRAP